MGLKICKDEEKGFFRVNEGKLGQRAWKLIKKSPEEAIFLLSSSFFFFNVSLTVVLRFMHQSFLRFATLLLATCSSFLLWTEHMHAIEA